MTLRLAAGIMILVFPVLEGWPTSAQAQDAQATTPHLHKLLIAISHTAPTRYGYGAMPNEPTLADYAREADLEGGSAMRIPVLSANGAGDTHGFQSFPVLGGEARIGSARGGAKLAYQMDGFKHSTIDLVVSERKMLIGFNARW